MNPIDFLPDAQNPRIKKIAYMILKNLSSFPGGPAGTNIKVTKLMAYSKRTLKKNFFLPKISAY